MNVGKAQVIAANRFLSQAEMEINAQYISQVLRMWGWSFKAIAAILANMQTESTINPAIYEGLNSGSTSNGFGLVQWTPNTKYKTWADQNGYTYEDIDAQLLRIKYELENGLQWISTWEYPMTFAEFTQDVISDVGYLAYAFMYNYERPATLNQPHRKANAQRWLDFIVDGGGSSVNPSPSPSEPIKGLSLMYKYFVTRRS